MRIAHFVHRYPPALGGSEAYFARLSRYLAGQGDQVHVFTTNAIDLESFWSSRGRVSQPGVESDHGVSVRRYRVRHWPGQRYLLKFLSLVPVRPLQCLTLSCNPIVPAMWTDAGRERFDLVHATAFPYAWPIMCGLRMARGTVLKTVLPGRSGVPFLLTPFLHLGDPRDPKDRSRRAYLSPPMMYLLRAADRIFVQTEIERRALLDLGLPDERLVLLGMGVEPTECTGGDRERARKAWSIDADEVVIGHLANQSVEKGTVDLLQAAERLWATKLPFRVLLAGPVMQNFTAFAKCKAFAGPITQLGVLTDSQKRDFFAAIDVFALPSRSDSFGLVFLEAWVNGVPCVAYRAGGVAEVIRHEQDGLLADCGDVAGLAAALRRIIEDAELRRSFGAAGHERTLREFRWEPRLARVHDVYREVTRR